MQSLSSTSPNTIQTNPFNNSHQPDFQPQEAPYGESTFNLFVFEQDFCFDLEVL